MTRNSNPARATAVGNVVAHQEGTDIQAGEITVAFEEVPELGPGADKSRLRARAVSFAASQDVRVTDERDAEPFVATADTITSDLRRGKFALLGAPARVSQGPNDLAAGEIHVDERNQSVTVPGPGTLRFETDRNVDGTRYDEPRPVRVAWSQRMESSGQRNTAEFEGDVSMDSELNHM